MKSKRAILSIEGGIIQNWTVDSGVIIHALDFDPFDDPKDPHICKCKMGKGVVHGHTIIENDSKTRRT